MSNLYGLKESKPPTKPLTQSGTSLPGVKTQEIYNALYKKRNTKLNGFETFLKSKLETSSTTGLHSLKQSPRLHNKPPLRNQCSPTEGPISIQANFASSRDGISTLATSRAQKTQNFASYAEKQKQTQTPTGVSLFFVKSVRGNKTPIRLTETFVKEKISRMNTLRRQNSVESLQQDREIEDVKNLTALAALESKRNKTIREGGDTSIVTPDVYIENQQTNTESLEEQQLSSRPLTNCHSPLMMTMEGSFTDRRGFSKLIKLNIPPPRNDLNEFVQKSAKEYRIDQFQYSANVKTSVSPIKRPKKIQAESARIQHGGRSLVRTNSLAKSRFDFSGTSPSMTSFQKQTEDTQIRTIQSIADRKENESPFGVGSQNSSPLKKKRELPKKAINEYIPDWLAGRNDFTKAIENKEGNLRNLMIKICSKLPSDRNSEEIEVVARWLRKISLFRNLADQVLDSIASNVKYRLYNINETVCLQGEPGDCLYIIYDGMVKCIVNGKEVAMFKTLDIAGQKALESSAPRTASLVAAVPTIILRLERDVYCTIMEYYIRQTKQEHLTFINQVNVLKDLKESKKEVITSCLQFKHYSAGEVVYSEGEPAETFYILKSGKLQIEAYVDVEKEHFWPISNDSRERTKVARNMKFKHIINPHEYFGEIELINRMMNRLNSIVCLEDSNILLMNKRDFNDLFDYGEVLKFREASKKHLLQNPDFMRKKLEEKEAEKRKLRNVMVSALKHHLSSLDQSQPKGTSIENSINKFKQEFKQYMRTNTVGKISKKFDVIPIK